MKKRSSNNWRSLPAALIHFKASLSKDPLFLPRCLLVEYQIKRSTICFIAIQYDHDDGIKWAVSHFKQDKSIPKKIPNK
jgi:hypothetical protein